MNKLITSISVATLALALGFSGSPATAANCGSAGCTVTFDYTGSLQTWQVPDGIDAVRFEVYGAGGGGGSQGGKVTGTLFNLPDTLYIAVGGEGTVGVRPEGGYNGGATGGGSVGDSGSGGGASDIRESGSWLTRLVVAGGGGGQGSGGNLGGNGGGLLGDAGSAGSLSGGGQPGTQLAGGLEGGPDFYGGGVAGSKHNGGVGGSGSGINPFAGGGGGGGGYYGGGGGSGSEDSDDTGSGGGGGSGYAKPSATADVQFTVGARSGHGLVILRYGATPELSSFTGVQTSANGGTFRLAFKTAVTGMHVSDLALNSASGCQLGSLSGGPTEFEVSVTGCTSSDVRLTLAADAVAIDESGPASAVTAALRLSLGTPNFSLTGNPTASTGDFNFDIQHGPEVQPLELADFEVVGCQPSIRQVSTGTRLVFADCADGSVRITLKADAIRDSFGNAGPSEDITRSIRVDGSRPRLMLTNLAPTNDASGYEVARIRLTASEPISVKSSSLSVVPAGDCRISLSGSGSERILAISGCASGSHRLVLPIGVVADQSGWLAPTSKLSWNFSVTDGVPASPAPTPTATPAPTPPTQIAPWIPIDMTTQPEVLPTDPIVVPDGAAGAGDGVDGRNPEADLSIWLVPFGLAAAFLLIAIVLLRKRKREESAENDGAAAVKKHSVFGKPADRLG